VAQESHRFRSTGHTKQSCPRRAGAQIRDRQRRRPVGHE
jgi:hypothetical protein